MCDIERSSVFSRRAALKALASGFGYLAFAGLASEQALSAPGRQDADPLAPKAPHFQARAKHVIWMSMRGGPSHVDTFDYKPKLIADDGKSGGSRGRGAKLLASPWAFKPRGKSGLMISDLFSEVGELADHICILNGMHTDVPAHPQAFLAMHTGSSQFVRPSVGAWVLYGLGTENRNLPGFISIKPTSRNGGSRNYGSAFLPAIYQGTRVGSESRRGDDAKLENIANPRWNRDAQRTQLDFVQSLNRAKLRRDPDHPGVDGVIESYELAFRMQSDVPKVMDISKEPKNILESYGIGSDATDDFGRQCLMARRLVEAGVRYIEVSHGEWDQHRNLKAQHGENARGCDKPIAALLQDLRQRGLLDDTLVVWAGEFGRTPAVQNGDGRDHNHKGFSVWMAGGGVKGGINYGRTDDYGEEAVEGKTHVHDLHATVLHLLGLDHEKLTYPYAGRDFRLTDVHGRIVREILA